MPRGNWQMPGCSQDAARLVRTQYGSFALLSASAFSDTFFSLTSSLTRSGSGAGISSS